MTAASLYEAATFIVKVILANFDDPERLAGRAMIDCVEERFPELTRSECLKAFDLAVQISQTMHTHIPEHRQ